MRTIAVIFPINNATLFNQNDLLPYQTHDCNFRLMQVDTKLSEINTEAEAELVKRLVIEKVVEAENSGASVAIVFAFDDLGIKEARELVSIPVMGLGTSAIHTASLICRKYYSVIPPLISYNGFIGDMITREGLQHNYLPASYELGISSGQLRINYSTTFDLLVTAANREITEQDIDTFTLGCGGFINFAKPLEEKLQSLHHKKIIVVDPVTLPFRIAQSLC